MKSDMSTTKKSNHLVLHIAPTPFFADRGCHIRIEGIVRSLRVLDWDSVVCTYHHGYDVEGVETRRIVAIESYTQTAAGPNPWKLWADLKLLWLSANTYRRERPDVIHAHLHEGLFIGLLVKWVFFWRRTPLIADLQGSFTGELDSHGVFKKLGFLKPIFRFAEKVLMWFPNHIVCSSERSLNLFINDFHINPERISLAQDGADKGAELSNKQRSALFKELGLPKDKTLVVYSGALLDSKGLKQLQKLIQRSDPLRTHFLIIGYPTEALAEFLATSQLNDRCSLLGQFPFERLPQLLQLSDIAVDPKNFDAGEGSGKMLNYMANGLPVLAFDTPNNRAFLPSNTPLAANVEDMANQLDSWLSDANERSATAQHNQVFFDENYSWTVTQGQLSDVYLGISSADL